MPDETAGAYTPHDLQSDLDRSRESAARLLDNLARRIGTNRAVRNAASGARRAATYVQRHSAKEVIADLERMARRRPAAVIAVAVVAGFLVGRAIKSR